MATEWEAHVLYAVDGTTQEMTIRGHAISVQIFPDKRQPRRGLIQVRDAGGMLVEVHQLDVWSVRKTRVVTDATK